MGDRRCAVQSPGVCGGAHTDAVALQVPLEIKPCCWGQRPAPSVVLNSHGGFVLGLEFHGIVLLEKLPRPVATSLSPPSPLSPPEKCSRSGGLSTRFEDDFKNQFTLSSSQGVFLKKTPRPHRLPLWVACGQRGRQPAAHGAASPTPPVTRPCVQRGHGPGCVSWEPQPPCCSPCPADTSTCSFRGEVHSERSCSVTEMKTFLRVLLFL